MVTVNQNNAYNYYPYTPQGVFNPGVQLVVPQGQAPSYTYNIPPQVVQPEPQKAIVNYNQLSPYINTRSGVFMPNVQAKSGSDVSSVISPQISEQEAQIVYQGPVKTVNPQVVGVEQNDNEINKQFRDYFARKAEVNAELRKALNVSCPEDKHGLPTTAKVIGALLLIIGAIRYRKKIPFVKKFFGR